MLSFDSSIWKSAETKIQSVARQLKIKKKPDPVQTIWQNFQRPLLLHPLQKHCEGAEDVDGVPLGNFYRGQFRNHLKKSANQVMNKRKEKE